MNPFRVVIYGKPGTGTHQMMSEIKAICENEENIHFYKVPDLGYKYHYKDVDFRDLKHGNFEPGTNRFILYELRRLKEFFIRQRDIEQENGITFYEMDITHCRVFMDAQAQLNNISDRDVYQLHMLLKTMVNSLCRPFWQYIEATPILSTPIIGVTGDQPLQSRSPEPEC